jgi:hypothetical protein
MRHLTTAQLVDLAEGATPVSATRHLQSCDACRCQLADLRAAMSLAAGVDAPEPSPMFWDHLSARVHDAVLIEQDSPSAIARGRLTAGVAKLAAWFRMRPAAIGGLVVLAAAVALFLQVGRPALGPVPLASTSAAGEAANDAVLPVDDPSLSFVADLAADLDWEAVREAGLIIHVGEHDALSQLSPGERDELRRLLQGELSPPRRGA